MIAWLEKVWYWIRSWWFRIKPRKAGKYGRLPASAEPFRAVGPLPAAPNSWTSPRLSWGMLGNDTYGDCVFAGLAHACMATGARLNRQPFFTANEVVQWYLNWNHGVDSGAIIDGVLRTWETDSETGHPFYGYGDAAPFARVDQTSVGQLKSAIATFGCVIVGAALQQAQEDQFSRGQMWQYVPGSPVVGGHCVVLTGFNSTGPYVVSWGKGFRATWDWVTNVCDEAYTGAFPAVVAAGRYVAPIVALDRYLSELPAA